MKGIIIIKKDHEMDHFGPHSMSNTICICDCILKDKEDGDEVEATIKGTLIEHDGKRYISVHTVDGEDVEEMDDMEYEGNDLSEPDMMDMDAEDALMDFMSKIKK